jgi:hypothetical protein
VSVVPDVPLFFFVVFFVLVAGTSPYASYVATAAGRINTPNNSASFFIACSSPMDLI